MAKRKNESEILKMHGQSVLTPAHPKLCSYVRIMDDDGREVAYWDSDEWYGDPKGVMGAIMGAIKWISMGTAVVPCDECNGTRLPHNSHQDHCSLNPKNES